MNLYFVSFREGELFAGGMYVWGSGAANAREHAERIGPPPDWTDAEVLTPPLDPRLVPFLPVGFMGRLLSWEECQEAERAFELAWRRRQANALVATA